VKRISIFDLPDELRSLVGECEVTGNRVAFERNSIPVAMLVSYDEWLALRETVAIVNDQRLIASWRKSEAEIARGAVVEVTGLERVRVTKSMSIPENAWALLRRIDDDPIAGAPLFEPLKGVWSARDGALRVVYRIDVEARAVYVMIIGEELTVDG
jgi:mRNA-degrading endonuclease RelE of RelBE toxin-antitoxin system/PHD/YefM family antitoxin component YafN of YafNO toxin-antitoxin module